MKLFAKAGLAGLVIAGLVVGLTNCSRAKVGWKKAVAQIDKVLGENQVKIQQIEDRIAQLKKNYRKQVEIKHMWGVRGEQAEEKAQELSEEMEKLQAKQKRMEDLIAKGEPYTADSGEEYTVAEMKELKAQVQEKAEDLEDQIKLIESRADRSEQLSDRAQKLQDRLKDTIEEASDRLTYLKAKAEELATLKQQIKLTEEISAGEEALSDSLIGDIEDLESELEGKVRAREEIFQELSEETSSMEEQLEDF
jgi:chromosome segregation ATPase